MALDSEMRIRSSSRKLEQGYGGHNLVFVVGSPRSGTTWLQRLLSSHSNVRTGQESYLFPHYIGSQLQNWRHGSNPQFRSGVGLACYFTEEEFLGILKTYLLTLLEPMIKGLAPDEMFLEKTPANALYLPEIFEFLPQARVIHVLRDARDVVSSLLAANWFSRPPDSANVAADIWKSHVKAVRDAMLKLPPQQFHEVRYENLSRSPADVLQGCADFLGLEWHADEIALAVNANRASTAKANGGGTPIPLFGEAARRSGSVVVEPKGFIRKAKPGAWKDDLSFYEKFRVWRVAHLLMDQADYHWSRSMDLVFACLSACVDLAKSAYSPGRYRRK